MLMFTLYRCRKEDAKTPEDTTGYASSDGGGTVYRCGCLICGVDFRRRRKTKPELRHQIVDEPVEKETESTVILPSRCTAPTLTSVRQPSSSQLRDRSKTGTQLRQYHSLKTGDHAPNNRTADAESPFRPLHKHGDSGDRHRRTVPFRPEPEMVSLSHYYRRHHHRARNHHRAMRQVAEWIENAGVVGQGAADEDAASRYKRTVREHPFISTADVVRHRKHGRRHVHEHHHHHYHYHYSVSGMV